MDDITGEQENNQLLLNAIRNKFAAKNESVSFSPPKFNIPNLKSTYKPNENASSSLNQFVLNQLNATGSTQCNNCVKSNFVIPLLKPLNSPFNINSLSSDLQEKLQLKDSSKNEIQLPMIDLTSALADKHTRQQAAAASARSLSKSNGPVDFDIPFIDCDRLNPQLPNSLYCQMDISDISCKHTLATPSNGGGIFSSLPRVKSTPHNRLCIRKVKHQIERFKFDTQSPDDKVLASLSRYR